MSRWKYREKRTIRSGAERGGEAFYGAKRGVRGAKRGRGGVQRIKYYARQRAMPTPPSSAARAKLTDVFVCVTGTKVKVRPISSINLAIERLKGTGIPDVYGSDPSNSFYFTTLYYGSPVTVLIHLISAQSGRG